jgi:hypothetical protein
MQPTRRNANPFAMMIDPQAVIALMNRSERLERLQRRVCRPLDKPLLGVLGEGQGEVDESDEDNDAADLT